MIPRADIEHPCESCGAPADGDLCPQCTVWEEIWQNITETQALLEVVECPT